VLRVGEKLGTGGKVTMSTEFEEEVNENSVKKLRLFGTSGIRGTANVDITPEMAIKLGVTFASFLGDEGTVAVGRDVRLGVLMSKITVLLLLLRYFGPLRKENLMVQP